jgi:ribosomal protein S18 acetylase RimI-like enzyme
MMSPHSQTLFTRKGLEVTITETCSDDHEQISKLCSKVFGAEVGTKAGLAIRDVGKTTGILGQASAASIQAKYWKLSIAEEVCGLVGLYQPRWIGKQSLYLGWFAVAPDFQGQGLGSVLFTYALKYAESIGAKRLLTETSPDSTEAIAFYEQKGFRVILHLDDYWEDGSPLALMELRCSS